MALAIDASHEIFFSDNRTVYRPIVEKAIAQYGCEPEHNADWYEYETHPDQKPIVIYREDGLALLTHQEENAWYTFAEPLAPPQKKISLLVQFIEKALSNRRIKKVVVELHKETRKLLRDALPDFLRDTAINYTLTWPIFDVKKFDSSIPGKSFKYIRNTRNKFYREHAVRVVDAKRVLKNQLIAMIKRWNALRGATDRAYVHRYINLTENNFIGTATARAFIVDGDAVALNAGWPIANVPGHYAAAVGIHDYSITGLGEIINLEDLEWIKSAGYTTADFGGGERALTNFKMKFHPASCYKTFVFSIVRR